jgi:hypothetical protein
MHFLLLATHSLSLGGCDTPDDARPPSLLPLILLTGSQEIHLGRTPSFLPLYLSPLLSLWEVRAILMPTHVLLSRHHLSLTGEVSEQYTP